MNKQHSLDELCPYIREAGLQRRDSWKAKKRKIYDHQFLYCFVGTAHAIIEDEYYEIKQGHMVVIPPDTPHTFWVDDDMSGELYWFHCDFFYFEDREWLFDFYNTAETYATLFALELKYPEHLRCNPIFENDYSIPKHISFKDTDGMEFLFRSIYKAYIKKELNWQISTKIFFLEIMELILRSSDNQKHINHSNTHVSKIINQYIAHNYYKKLTVKEICNYTGFNPEYASKLFKKETGIKLIEYLNKYRIEKSKKLLLDIDLSIADIAEMVGFNNENYYCSVTKKLEGKTPAKLRSYLLAILDESQLNE